MDGGGLMARWVHAAASVAGTAHKARGEACQDRHAVQLCRPDDTILSVVVSDGAGSALFGGEGAHILCDALSLEIQDYLSQGGSVLDITHDQAQLWLARVRADMMEKRLDGATLGAFACTLLVAVVAETAAAFLQIGDGAIVIKRAHRTSRAVDKGCCGDGLNLASNFGEAQVAASVEEFSAARVDGPEVVFWPQQGEYINTTRFVTDDDYREALQVVVYHERLDEVAIFTDGLQQLLLDYPRRQAHGPFFGSMFGALRAAATGDQDPEALCAALEAYLDCGAINERTQDDKTLVIAQRTA